MSALLRIAIVIACIGLAPLAYAATVTVAWTPATTFDDGSPLTGTVTYRVRCADWTPTGGAAGACFKAYAQGGIAPLSPRTSVAVDVGAVPAVGGSLCFEVRTEVGGQVSPWAKACKLFAAATPRRPNMPTSVNAT